MSLDRRRFLADSAAALGAGIFGPSRLRFGTSPLREEAPPEDRTLLILELFGGNDDLNTFVPVRNDRYYQLRPSLGIRRESAIRINDDWGLHPILTTFERLWKDGRLAVLHSIGHPHPDLSHFRSIDIWGSAYPEAMRTDSGWIGRALARQSRLQPDWRSSALHVGGGPMPLALQGSTGIATSIRSLEDFDSQPRVTGLGRFLAERPVEPATPALELATRRAAEAQDLAKLVDRIRGTAAPTGNYPASEIGRDLRLASLLLESPARPRVLYVRYTGFDTHLDQKNFHSELLYNLGWALDGLVGDLERDGILDRTVIFAFTEFGRRVAQNANDGTDHGKACAAYLIGGRVKGGFLTPAPDLENLDEGDVRHRIDFRDLYASLLENWLGIAGARAEVSAPGTNVPDLFA